MITILVHVTFSLPPSLPPLIPRSLQLINRDLSEEFYTLSSYPDSLYKKVTLLKYFQSYMTEHLLKAGGAAGVPSLSLSLSLSLIYI